MTGPRIAVFLDPADEDWRAMDLCGEMLVSEWRAPDSAIEPVEFRSDLPRLGRRLPFSPQAMRNFDRIAGRFFTHPVRAARERGRFDLFHVVDHTYAQLLFGLPRARSGVYCHDLDAFRPLIDPVNDPRPAWFRAMASVTLRGMQCASVVFHSTNVVRGEIERAGLVPSSRLVHAPYGVSPGLDAVPREDLEMRALLAPLGGRPYLLHVGSGIGRKRLDVVFDTMARLRPQFPELRLVQNGAALDASQRAHITRCGLDGVLFQPPHRIDRDVLGALYRRAAAVLVTSDAEGFGLPVLEGLACGSVVLASDIPVLREVGGGVVVHCRVGDPEHWAATLRALLEGTLAVPSLDRRLAEAAKYTWAKHANTISDAYRALGKR